MRLVLPEIGDGGGEDVGPHHGVEEAGGNQEPEGGVAAEVHRCGEEDDVHTGEHRNQPCGFGTAHHKGEDVDHDEDEVRKHRLGTEGVGMQQVVDADEHAEGGEGNKEHRSVSLHFALERDEGEGSEETPDHQASPVKGKVVGRALFGKVGNEFQGEVDEATANAHFRTHIAEDGEDAKQKGLVLQCSRARLQFLVVLERRKRHDGNQQGDEQEEAAEQEVRDVDVGRIAQLGQQDAAQHRRERGAERVECLRQVQPSRRALRLTEQGDVWVGRNLQDGDSQTDDEQSCEEKPIQVHCGGGVEEGAACRRNQQTCQNPLLVTDLVDGIPGGDGDEEVDERPHEVGAEEAELHEHRGSAAQLEHLLQFWNQDVVHAGDEAPHEEKADNRCKGKGTLFH